MKARHILLALDWFDPRIYRGVARYAIQANWHLSPYVLSRRNRTISKHADGVITCYEPRTVDLVENLKVPAVDISFLDLPSHIPKVQTDNARIGRLAVEHFLKRGYENFAFYSWDKVPVNQDRLEHFFKAAREIGIPEENLYIIEQPDDTTLADWEAHTATIKEQLDNMPRPLAVFTGQDNLGASLIDICIASGINVPDEISVLGVDNEDYLCDSLAVPLSSIDSRLEELGYQAAEQLDKLLDGEISPEAEPRYTSPGQVVRRRSSDAIAVSHPQVAQALRIMRTQFSQGLTLEQVWEAVGMSRRGLEKAFLTQMNSSPAAELRRIKLDYAKRLLAQTDTKIDAIANECGYCNNSNLSLAFRKYTGISPSQYRQKYQKR